MYFWDISYLFLKKVFPSLIASPLWAPAEGMALKYCYCGCRNDMKYTEQKMPVWMIVPTQYWFLEVLVIMPCNRAVKEILNVEYWNSFFIESWIEVALVSAFNLATFSCRWYKVMLKEVLRYPLHVSKYFLNILCGHKCLIWRGTCACFQTCSLALSLFPTWSSFETVTFNIVWKF